MPPSPSDERFPLQVQADDGAAEIFVIDARLQVVARGIGSVSATLPAGIYKVNIRVGNATEERLVELPATDPVTHFTALKFASPVPMPDTRSFDPEHLAIASRVSRDRHARVGSGSSILVMARALAGREQDLALPPNVLTGLRLTSADGGPVDLKLAELAADHAGVGPRCAATSIELDPGPYVLRLTAGELDLAQIVYASAGWQTQVFLPMRSSTQGDSCADLEHAAILMGRGDENDLSSEHARLAEIARLALIDQRKIARDELRLVLAHKFSDPLLGILGAHLLLMEKQPDYELLRVVTTNLLGRLQQQEHPDVQALALAPELGNGPSSYVFRTPPMLRASWSLILQSSVGMPERVAPDSLAARAAGRLAATQPWLVWRERDSDEQRDRRLVRAITAFQETQAFFDDVAAVTQKVADSRDPAAGIGGAVRVRSFSLTPGARAADADDEMMKKLVSNLGIPRQHIEALLRRSPKSDGD